MKMSTTNRYEIIFSARFLALIGFGILLFPVLLFLVGFLRWYIGIPLAFVVTFGFSFLARMLKNENDFIRMDWRYCLTILIVVFAWAFFCGQGGFWPQSADHLWRNAIFYDLIHGEWPVTYDTYLHGKLVYYFCYWLPAAVVGKLFLCFGDRAGTLAGHVALLFWTTLNLFVIVLLLLNCLENYTKKAVCLTLTILIFFSGMDYLGQIILCHSFQFHHLEWWTNIWQYSSNTTQLGWVFNQAIPAWISTALFLRFRNRPEFYGVFMGLLIGFSPFPSVGFAGVLLMFSAKIFFDACRKKQIADFMKRALSLPNLLIFFSVFPVFALFFMTNRNVAGSDSGSAHLSVLNMNHAAGLIYILFICVEFLLLALVIWHKSEKQLWYPAVLELVALPLFRFISCDFYMRVSIPALFILMFLVIRYFLPVRETGLRGLLPRWILGTFLIYGAITPVVEFADSIRHVVLSDRFRLDYINSYAEYLQYWIIDNNPEESMKNFFAANPDESFFFRYLAKQNVKPMTTPDNEALANFLCLSLDEKRKVKNFILWDKDNNIWLWYFPKRPWILFFHPDHPTDLDSVFSFVRIKKSDNGTTEDTSFFRKIPVKTKNGIIPIYGLSVNEALEELLPSIQIRKSKKLTSD